MKFIHLILLFFSANLFGSAGCANGSELSKRLGYVVQPPLFSEVEPISLSGEEIVELVRAILKNRLGLTNYDRIFPALQFLDHYENCKRDTQDISPIEALKTFRFQPLLPSNRGGACVSLTFDLYNCLPSSLKGYMALAKLPGEFQQMGFPKYSHVAVLIKYQSPLNVEDRGYVLLEPGFDIDEPILLKSNGDPFFYKTKKKGIWKFYLDNEQIICDLPNKQNKDSNFPVDYFRMVYLTECVLNPIEASAIPMMLADRRLSLLSRREDGSHRAHLNIELNKKRVIWDRVEERFDPISFSQFCQDGWTFPIFFANELYLSNIELTNKILRIVKNKPILDALYLDYMKLLKETQDFSITGAVNFDPIDKVLETLESDEILK
jgi:hypothetical protein